MTFFKFEKNSQDSHGLLGICAICEKVLAKNDFNEIDELHFCHEHYQTYQNEDWEAITNQKTTADSPEKGVYIYNFKNKIWENEKIPSYIKTNYNILEEENIIETYVKLYVPKDLKSNLKQRLKNE